jgi:hypothetical protein
LQRRVQDLAGARAVRWTRHYENETLYWTKAASILGLPQHRPPGSEVPLSKGRALSDLEIFFEKNCPAVQGPFTSREALYHGWDRLSEEFGPVFVDKTPHYLYQPAVIELMEHYADTTKAADVAFLGLVRNPMAFIYSAWRRWGVPPEAEEVLWRNANQSLLELAQRRPQQTAVLKYEELVGSDTPLQAALTRLALPVAGSVSSPPFHDSSLQKWKSDRRFGFSLSPETLELARAIGYSESEVENPNAGPWATHRFFHGTFARAFCTASAAVNRVRHWRPFRRSAKLPNGSPKIP